MPVPMGFNAKQLQTVARWSLGLTVLTAPALLWWPGIKAWTVLAVACGLLWLAWLAWRTVAGRTDIPVHTLHLALLGVAAMATIHLIRAGVRSPGGQGLLGQFDASIITQLSLLALLILMVQDLLAGVALNGALPTIYGAIVLLGGVAGLVVTTRPEGRLMLAMMGWTGLALFCLPLAAEYAGVLNGPLAGAERLRAWSRRLTALIAAVLLAALCPPAVPIVTGAVAVTLLVGAACLRGQAGRLAVAGVVAAIFAGAHAWSLGWIRQPHWPTDLTGWIGRGGETLVDTGPWTNDLSLLTGAVGWIGTLWLLVILAGSLLRTLLRARRGSPEVHARVLLSVLTTVLATTAWLSPGGFFTPAVNVVFAVVWAFWPAAMGIPIRRRSGWLAFAVIVWVSLALGMVRKAGLLIWATQAYRKDDSTLHLVIGWVLTQALLWLLSRRHRGAVAALAISLAAAGAGELAQRMLGTRSAQAADFLHHAKGAACALAIYILCRACRWCESPDIPARPGRQG